MGKKRLDKMSGHDLLLLYKRKNSEKKRKSRQLKNKLEDRHADNSMFTYS